MTLKHFLGNLAKGFLATGALSVSAYAGADTYQVHQNYVQPCAPAACESCCCGQPCLEPPVCGWAYNPPAYCRCNAAPSCDPCGCNDGWELELDFLWWRSCVTGLALGSEESTESFVNSGSAVPQTFTTVNDSHVKKLDFKYDPGFRIGLFNHCSCDCWDIGLVWTHYHTKATANGASSFDVDGDPTVIFINYWERARDNPDTNAYRPDFAKGRYALNLDLLDLEFGRKYYVSNCFALRPQFGLRGARINQSYRTFAVANRGEPGVIGTEFLSATKSHNNFLAVGPRVGLEAEVHLGCGFALFGDAAGSLLFGRFERHSKEHLEDFSTTSASFTNEFNYETHASNDRCSRAITDLSFGFKWSRCFDWCNRLHPVSIAFAWEHHAFWNFNNFNFVPNAYDVQAGEVFAGGSRKSGDIFTQGLTLRTTFGF